MSSDVVISVHNLTKTYRLFGHPGDRVKQFLSLGLKQYHRDFTALKNISFDIRKGEAVGIIGRNGSGKSTLLQLVCGILKPTAGTVRVSGTISALLELGAGFNPEFTGRENVYFQGTLMGFTKAQIDERFDAVAAFADIGQFIDQPVRTYSSGMFVRLAFAVAANAEPDIFVVDEALAVGDAAFQRKCFSHLDRIRDNGCTILFVSHDAGAVITHCNRAVLLAGGEVLLSGYPKQVVDRYLSGSMTTDSSSNAAAGKATPCYDPSLMPESTIAYPRHGAEIRGPRILDLEGSVVNLLRRGHEYHYVFEVQFDRAGIGIRFGMMIKTLDGKELGGLVSSPAGYGIVVKEGMEYQQRFLFRCNLLPGSYFLNAGVIDQNGNFLHRIIDAAMFVVLPEPGLVGTGNVDISSGT